MQSLENSFAALACTLQARITTYDDAVHVQDRCAVPLALEDGAAEFACCGGQWRYEWATSTVPNRDDAVDLRVCITLTEGQVRVATVGVELAFARWSTEHYVGMPSGAYAGNRFESRKFNYPPLLRDPHDLGVDVPIIIGDVPRLNIHDWPSRLQLLTNDLATPAVGIVDPATQQACWLVTDVATPLGYTGFVLEESDDRNAATLTVMAPGVRADERYWFMQMRDGSNDRPADFAAGDTVELRLRLYIFPAQDIPALYARFMDVRKDLTGPTVIEHCLPFSSAWAIQEEKYNRDNWQAHLNRYTVGTDGDASMYGEWQIGWTGGGMATLPLLVAGSDETRRRTRQWLDFIFTTQAPSGFFHGIAHKGGYPGDGFNNPGTEHWLLLRKNADFLYFIYKEFTWLCQQGEPIPATWEDGARRLADAFVTLWGRYGQLGQFIDVLTGEIIVGGSTSAGIASAGLALAAQYCDNPAYLEVAEAIVQHYYDTDVRAGVTTGGPGEILQSPDSESAFGLLESLVVLAEVTGKREWVAKAIDMANLCATWVVSYDFPFPPASLFGRLGIHATGAVWASVQNKHGSPGICTLSGDALLKLFRMTGEAKYLDLLRDIAHALNQCLSRADRPIGKMPSGWITERVNLSDWLEGVGEIFEGCCWPEVSIMLTHIEVPGVYVQPDTGLVCAIDHVDAEIIAKSDLTVTLRLTNPTQFPARVRVFAEPSTACAAPLGQRVLWESQFVEVAAGETVVASIPLTS